MATLPRALPPPLRNDRRTGGRPWPRRRAPSRARCERHLRTRSLHRLRAPIPSRLPCPFQHGGRRRRRRTQRTACPPPPPSPLQVSPRRSTSSARGYLLRPGAPPPSGAAPRTTSLGRPRWTRSTRCLPRPCRPSRARRLPSLRSLPPGLQLPLQAPPPVATAFAQPYPPFSSPFSSRAPFAEVPALKGQGRIRTLRHVVLPQGGQTHRVMASVIGLVPPPRTHRRGAGDRH